jgi:muramidase (phage lysozyme)
MFMICESLPAWASLFAYEKQKLKKKIPKIQGKKKGQQRNEQVCL